VSFSSLLARLPGSILGGTVRDITVKGKTGTVVFSTVVESMVESLETGL